MPVHTGQLDSLRRKALLAGRDTRWDAPRGHAVHARAATVRLVDLNADIHRNHGILIFDCPNCCCQQAHAIRVHLAAPMDTSEALEDLTVEGLIELPCWRGRIANGRAVSDVSQ